MKQKVKYDRKYLGITITAQNYREIMAAAEKEGKSGRHEINYHTRHLEAYLKGKTSFRHGFRYDKKGAILGPAYFAVKQKLTEIE